MQSLISILNFIRNTSYLLTFPEYLSRDPIIETEQKLAGLSIQLWQLNLKQEYTNPNNLNIASGMLSCIVLDLHSYTISQSFSNPQNTKFHQYMKYLITAACLQTFHHYVYTNPNPIDHDEYIMFDVFYNYSLDQHNINDTPQSEAFLIQNTPYHLHTVTNMVIQTTQGYAFLELFRIDVNVNPTLHDQKKYVAQIQHCYNLRKAQNYIDFEMDYKLIHPFHPDCDDDRLDYTPYIDETSNRSFGICKLQQIFEDCNITLQQFTTSANCRALIHTYKLNHHPLSTHPTKYSKRYTIKTLHHNLHFHPIFNAKELFNYLSPN